MSNGDQARLAITRPFLWALFIYYAMMAIGTLVGLLFFFHHLPNPAAGSFPIWPSILGSFLSSALGSSVYCLRKVYKHCIRDEFEFSQAISPREIGTAAYFFSRPLFACAFAFLVVISLKAENKFVSPSGVIDAQNFLYVSMFVAFLSGFGAGKVLTQLERKGVPIDD